MSDDMSSQSDKSFTEMATKESDKQFVKLDPGGLQKTSVQHTFDSRMLRSSKKLISEVQKSHRRRISLQYLPKHVSVFVCLTF